MVENRIAQWRKNLPWIKPFYAIKSNPLSHILADVQKHSCGFDCASKNEIKKVLQLGEKPSNIVFSNPVKTDADITYAYRKGVRLTTADTIAELHKIQRLAPKMKVLWRISIKESSTDNLATVFSNKFGDDLLSLEQAKDRFQEIKRMGIAL